jgi:general nucleoside transport system ATP-binding protein
MMVGRKVILQVEKGDAHPGEPVLTVEDLEVDDDLRHHAVRGLSLTVQAGEILGVAGVQGNGQRELVEALTGLRRAKNGRILLEGKDITNKSPRHITELGVAHIPEDREKHGLVGPYSIADNMVLNRYFRRPYARGIVMNHDRIRRKARRWWPNMTCVRPAWIHRPATCPAVTSKR